MQTVRLKLETQQASLNSSVFSFSLNVAKDSGMMGRLLTSFSEFHILDAAWLYAVDEDLVRVAPDSMSSIEERQTVCCLRQRMSVYIFKRWPNYATVKYKKNEAGITSYDY